MPTNLQTKKICVIGGGASGFFTSILLGEFLEEWIGRSQVQIQIFEASKEPLQKVKISGGGRCNVTHNLFSIPHLVEKYPRGNQELKQAFSRFQPKDTIEWFSQKGISLKTEPDGRMFPITNSSQTIIDCFQEQRKKYGIPLHLSKNIRKIAYDSESKKFQIVADEESLEFDFLIFASGSNRNSFELIKSLGHSIVSPVPSLFTLNIPDPTLHELSGQSVNFASIHILPKGKKQVGPILVTHWGLSGPAVLRLSAYEAREFFEKNYQLEVEVNWLGEKKAEEFLSDLEKWKSTVPAKSISSVSPEQISSRLWNYFLVQANVEPSKKMGEISKLEIRNLSQIVCKFRCKVDGKSVYKEEFVTAGGVQRKEVQFGFMESKLISNLYFVGEVLDIDGITGGFNFQNAWTTSYICAKHISQGFFEKGIA